MATLRQQLEELVDRLSPEMEKAFLDAVDQIRSDVVISRVIEALDRRDVDAALEALHIDNEAFAPLKEALRQAFNAGGSITVGDLPQLFDPMGARVLVRWDASNQRAEAKISTSAAQMVTGIVETTKEAARQTILAGYEQGQGPNTIALDLVGRKSPVTGKREGGVIGLSGAQASLINRTRANLLSGDPDLMAKYLTLQTRDKRLDGAVRKAIAAGKPLDAETLNKVLMRLRDKNLKLRGETISRTETLMAVTSAKHEAYLQALNKTGRDESLVTRRWRAVGDAKTRHSHMILNGQAMKGMDTPFIAENGDMLRFPGDRELGAGPASVVNCRCDCAYVFDFAEAYARSRGR